MFRTIVFKIVLGIYFTLWSPLLLIGLVSKKLSRKLVFADAAGVLLLARWICGIKYTVHYPQTEENGIPNLPDGNKRIDGKCIVVLAHFCMSVVVLMFICGVLMVAIVVMCAMIMTKSSRSQSTDEHCQTYEHDNSLPSEMA